MPDAWGRSLASSAPARTDAWGRAARVTTGMDFGPSELADLVALEQWQMAQMDAAKACPLWASADPQGYGQWAAALYDADAAMQGAIAFAQAATGDLTNAFKGLVAAAKPYPGLIARLRASGRCSVPFATYSPPAPKSADFDVAAYAWVSTLDPSQPPPGPSPVPGAAPAPGTSKPSDTSWITYLAIGAASLLALLVGVPLLRGPSSN